MIDQRELAVLSEALKTLGGGFDSLPDVESAFDTESVTNVLQSVATRMQDNYPYHHPLYAGQMLKPPHPVARIAYMLALWINPNNHALDGSRASSPMEVEAVKALAGMIGFEQYLGHLTSGGTMANLEALWASGQLHPGQTILASQQSHYTHERICGVLQLDFEPVPVNHNGQMCMQALEERLAAGGVSTVVATLGTTGVGAVDPLDRILALRERYPFRVHVDAAYGGYFRIASRLGADAQRAFDSMPQADSVVIDPHKHGLQPYGCGSVIYRDPAIGKLYKHDSPYTYFSSDDLHLGEISLECSRAGAAAVALWATQQLLPLDAGGEFAGMLDNCLLAANRLYERLRTSEQFRPLLDPQIDIVIYAPAKNSASAVSAASSTLFEAAAEADLHLALIQLPAELVQPHWPDLDMDQDVVTCLRSCLMKPEHLDWVEPIVDRLEALAD